MLTVLVYQRLRFRTFFEKLQKVFESYCFQKIICFMNLNERTSGRFEIFFIAGEVLCLSVFLYGPVQ